MVSGDYKCKTYNFAIKSGFFPSNSQIEVITGYSSIDQCKKHLLQAVNLYLYKVQILEKPSSKFQDASLKRKNSTCININVNGGQSHRAKGFNLLKTDEPILLRDDVPIEANCNYSVLIDRLTFEVSLRDEQCRKMLIYLLFCAKAVCFCNMFPQSKALVVDLLRNNL